MEHPTLRLRADWQVYAIRAGIRPSVSALAIATGLAHSTLYRVVRGEQAPNAEVIAALLIALGVSFGELFEVVK